MIDPRSKRRKRTRLLRRIQGGRYVFWRLAASTEVERREVWFIAANISPSRLERFFKRMYDDRPYLRTYVTRFGRSKDYQRTKDYARGRQFRRELVESWRNGAECGEDA